LPNVTIIQIKSAVCTEFGLTCAELVGRSREAKFQHPRVLAMQLARELTNASFPVIANAFGGRHHSTIMSSVARAHNLIDAFPEYLDRRNAILRSLGIDPT
jgi:chromosomal replication initiation ATPase DnaA